MSEYGGSVRLEDEREPYTVDEILKRFLDYIDMQKPGLKRFYKWGTQGEVDQYLKDPVARGLAMTRKLMDHGCPRETAAALSLLALYDLVILIDNSLSMGIGEAGTRVETLSKTLRAASTVYSFAEQAGVTAVRFLNTSNKYFNVTPDKITALMKKIVFEGLTDIGNKLQERVLVNHVTPDMKKPLLVIIITDAEIEGEPIDQLRNAITNQAVELWHEHGDHGPEAVAYQLAKIGNDKVAQNLVASLDGDDKLSPYVDCMGNKTRLEDLPKNVWRILPKLFLGAISSYWDTEALTNATFRNKDDELPSQFIDDGDELERESDPPNALRVRRNESRRGDKISSNITPPRKQSGAGPSRNGRTNSTQAKNPADGSPPTNGQANTAIQDQSRANGSSPIHSQANTAIKDHNESNGSSPTDSLASTVIQDQIRTNGSSPIHSQANTTIKDQIRANGSSSIYSQANANIQDQNRANGSSPIHSQANTATKDHNRANGSLPTDSQANSSPPTDGHVNTSSPTHSTRPIQGGAGSWLSRVVTNSEAGPSSNGQTNITIPPLNTANRQTSITIPPLNPANARTLNRSNASSPTDDASPIPNRRGSGLFHLTNPDIFPPNGQAKAGPSPNGQTNTTIPPLNPTNATPSTDDASPIPTRRGSALFHLTNPGSDTYLPGGQTEITPPPRSRERRSFPLDSQVSPSSLSDDQADGSPGRRGKVDTRLKRVIRAFQPGDGVPRSA